MNNLISLAPLRRRAALAATLAVSAVGVGVALPSSALADNSIESETCNTGLSQECYATVTVDRGPYTVTFLFSNGGSATGHETCSASSCTQRFASVPPTGYFVDQIVVVGNNVRNLSTS